MNSKAAAPATSSKEVALIGKSTGLVARIAGRFQLDPDKMLETLKQTAFKVKGSNAVVTNEHMMALLVISEQYHLNPFTREIYAFPSEGGIVPIIPVDGWLRIVNEHPQLESLEVIVPEDDVDSDNYWTDCVIVRKDRKKPIKVREWLKECYRNTGPWNSHPKRMLRHKAIIQCARVAFGFAGVFDPDEGERIYAAAIDVTPRAEGKPHTEEPKRRVKAETETPPPAETVQVIAPDQAILIYDHLKEEGIANSLFLAHFQVGMVEELPATKFQDALLFIENQSAGE